ncbi:hypothetical protein FHT81_004964 [Rhizobium sp. BK252]|uniref:Uncharacterized protein n=1 Tax=Rhizobium tropici TaxID=398 RepID=A0A329YAZ0_RHITR|nr:hypothetical protein [Rhizobium sp. BK252]MBB3404744.1 hypothetical protein [Rhizobium sp. BK289]MBB3417378.1 hypothetical protein [Rhizobium sp. BK284]RAX40068.1 hypothetical protein DQ393_19685 [Rhizobium tropici]
MRKVRLLTNHCPCIGTPDIPGPKDVHIRTYLKLDSNGRIAGESDVVPRGGPGKTQKIVVANAMRTVLRAASFKNLPQAQFDNETSRVDVLQDFDPGHMAL